MFTVTWRYSTCVNCHLKIFHLCFLSFEDIPPVFTVTWRYSTFVYCHLKIFYLCLLSLEDISPVFTGTWRYSNYAYGHLKIFNLFLLSLEDIPPVFTVTWRYSTCIYCHLKIFHSCFLEHIPPVFTVTWKYSTCAYCHLKIIHLCLLCIHSLNWMGSFSVMNFNRFFSSLQNHHILSASASTAIIVNLKYHSIPAIATSEIMQQMIIIMYIGAQNKPDRAAWCIVGGKGIDFVLPKISCQPKV